MIRRHVADLYSSFCSRRGRLSLRKVAGTVVGATTAVIIALFLADLEVIELGPPKAIPASKYLLKDVRLVSLPHKRETDFVAALTSLAVDTMHSLPDLRNAVDDFLSCHLVTNPNIDVRLVIDHEYAIGP